MVDRKNMVLRFLKGYRKTAVFAVTTQCNLKCIMCGMYKNPQAFMSLEKAKKVLELLLKNRFLIVYFTGGEPTLHPNINEVVRFANQLGLVTTLTTNGSSSKKVISDLRSSGLHLLSVSLDHWNSSICEKIRGVEGIKERQEEIIRYSKKIGLKVYALVYLNPFLVEDGVEKIIKYVNHELRVPIGFCYPTESEINTFQLSGASYYKTKLNQKLREAVRVILFLKKSGYKIMNAETYLEDVLYHYENMTPDSYCKGGELVVYVDWFGDVYPCFLKTKLFNLLEDGDARFLKNTKCNDCFINCFREPSILPQAFVSPTIFFKEVFYSHNVGFTII